jgi:hypothetical protein
MKDTIFREEGFECSPFGPPDGPGVYAICVMPNSLKLPLIERLDYVVYIGSSKHMSKRILNLGHIYRRLFNLLRNYCVYTMCFECNEFYDMEKRLIRKYKPRFNRERYGA